MSKIDIEALVEQIIKGSQLNTPSSPEGGEVSASNGSGAGGVFHTVDEAVAAAKEAQKKYFHTSLARRKKVIQAIRDGLAPKVEELAERAYEETGMGNVEDKIVKNRLAVTQTPGVEDLKTEIITGDAGMTLYELCPYGVIGAIAPSTNPTETLICNTIGMLAAGNAVYFSPHPGAKQTSIWLVRLLNKIVKDASGIDHLIATIDEPSIQAAQEMMVHPDINLLVVTGGPGVVRQAMMSGKKVLGAGAGNPPAIVDETAVIEKAAADIVAGAAFDNNILCIAEKNIVVVESIADFLSFQMEKAGAVIINELKTIKKLEELVLTSDGKPNKAYIGKPAAHILQSAGIPFSGNPKLAVVVTTPEHPFAVEEMLMPVVPFIHTPDFDTALEVALELEQGLHHTATMHSQNVTRLNKAARAMKTSIFVKNGPSYAGLGFKGEGSTTFTIATPTGEGTTTARHFARTRRCVLTDGFSIK
ncbi:propionaldehyde dehydrogenase [Evansella caseinilytica]|uniref:Propionaldehyde dehydrogenase n=1 Tax=Evansella caseinilytica TaxID=1503961 RepID=A0A1H3HX06_9BACI|nr:aldehyde dehydrogenase family protein [Evansella caseinilytica]SDY19986.1 propionaldehyde dehydrogenase [Evansella caseinilytica]